MKLLLDINILLDVLLDRDAWSDAAAQLLSAIESGRATAFVAAHTLPTVYYVMAQSQDRNTAAAAMGDLLRILEVAPMEKRGYQEALALPISDFEDAIHVAAALKIGADYLVTRNERDFRSASVPVADPATVLALL